MTCNAAQAAQAIVDLINSRPQSPAAAEIAAIIEQCTDGGQVLETSPLPQQLRAAMAAETAAGTACYELPDGPALDSAVALYDRCHAEVLALARQIPSPPRRFEDLALLAEVAFHYADCIGEGQMKELDDDDVFMSSAARLIEAVLQFARVRPRVASRR